MKAWLKLLFGDVKKENTPDDYIILVDILKKTSFADLKKAIPEAHPGYHYSRNPPKTVQPKEKKRKVGTTSRAQDC